MNRKPKENPKKVDLLKPLAVPETKPDDCFGQMWEPQNKDCAICNAIDVCGIVYRHKVIQPKKTSIEHTAGPFLDSVNFDAVDLGKIEKLALQYQEDIPLKFAELVDFVMELANTKDITAVHEFLKRELPLTNMYIKGEEIYV